MTIYANNRILSLDLLPELIRLSVTETSNRDLGMNQYIRYTRNGGMRFLRLGKLQLSWCVCKSFLVRAPQ